MFPSDAVSIYYEQVGAGSHTLVSGTNVKYVLGVQMQQSGVASDSILQCGSSVISRNYAKNLTFELTSYRCADIIQIVKTGNDNVSVEVTYVPRDIVTTQDPLIRTVSVVQPVYVNFASASGIAMHDMTYIMWTGFIVLIMALGIQTALMFMKRR